MNNNYPTDSDFEDLYENAPCGYLSVRPDGRIDRANRTLAGWMGYQPDDLPGMRLSELLNMAGRIFLETHVAPLLRMQGFFDEFALDLLTKSGARLPAIANARERRTDADALLFTRLTIMRATDRRRYERELIDARKESDELKSALEERLQQERANAELREQFIAVLGHDLRNPLASIAAGARLMLKAKTPEDALRLEAMMQSSVGRMAKMIESVMDLARGRLGGGISLSKSITAIEPVLDQVVAELTAAHPERRIEASFEVETPVFCDPARIAQLFSNLLGNAISHGAPDQPVRVEATAKAEMFELSVANGGAAIPEEARTRLFQPFYRGKTHGPSQGLGLGLYIAAEIAKAHGGSIEVASSETETRFTMRMPLEGDGSLRPHSAP
ncbi:MULTISPECIES: PAS domain-containing sensor histidine kinase [unclassified Bradyrhizobium]|uniref:PAS domain-containing sensor histidine kinase n=1 Tax=unclassified Bradyrhizobium TaxID=2631580 RepID=UPI001FF820D3|nr:PAS domain-containing sensor histidine kinase [Bradyrhizobium sp. 30]MCK1304744.1 PAS domain-containing sensor histidine kinase [Bradyrhizobium sp. 45]MCK1314125.1 PAS domain-containing sensor histidine kinase [Bradyrhizobium sp. 23]MCK1505417.1 PAS domain-containing sensor histidine kinase [Bradyrhizobium sp. 18]MCK1608137.1 PAS domain-containing sensor histidine kinase [Bradyrhizobium sp. 163]MCK1763013.1 PAS domain-containing sensor histidine kinase [Bradyrhizobium sp. 136]